MAYFIIWYVAEQDWNLSTDSQFILTKLKTNTTGGKRKKKENFPIVILCNALWEKNLHPQII